MKKNGVDQHQCGHAEREFGSIPAHHRTADPKSNHKSVDHGKMIPTYRQMQYILGPAFPVKGKFLQDMHRVGERDNP